MLTFMVDLCLSLFLLVGCAIAILLIAAVGLLVFLMLEETFKSIRTERDKLKIRNKLNDLRKVKHDFAARTEED